MRKIIRETITKDQAITQFKSMSEPEKMGWIKAIKECIQELGYGSLTRSDIAASTFGIGLIVMGVKLKIPELCLIGAGTIGAVAHFEKDVWVKIINCAKNKRKETDSIPDEQVMETKMKKIVKLTESDLVKLVQRIIKEDEMMAGDSSMATNPKGVTLAQLGIKESAYMAYLKGTTPFYVNGKEQKQNIIIKPTDLLYSKNCMIEFVGNKTKMNFTLVFDNNGKASLKK